MVADGELPPRPGIARLIPEAMDAGWTVTVASTSAEESVRAVLQNAVGRVVADRIPLFAGDIVAAKKPDPAIYTLALDLLGADPADTLVIEDSRNGLLSAVGAGLPCLITVNGYTRGENFDQAVLVVSELGDPGRPPIEILANRSAARPSDYVTLGDLQKCIRSGGGRPGGSKTGIGQERDKTREGDLR
jgi:HAD superfamily hydrolase (TIGR01509 family)